MKINGMDVKPSHKLKNKARVPVSGSYCRWESAGNNGSAVVSHRQFRAAMYRAVHLHGAVRSVAYLPDGIVHHGEWKRV